jgi:hypothetical protein
MKKFLVVLVVVAMTCMSSMAFAADVAVSGSIEMLMRAYANLDMNDTTKDNTNYTQERVRLNIDAKAGDALSGRISIENDWDTWGRFESVQANGAETTVVTDPTGTIPNPGAKTTHGTQLAFREAWIGFKVPGAPVGIKAGHMLLQLGNAWFFRSMKYGSDAWVVYTDINALHLGVVDIKVAEGTTSAADDVDAYAFVSTYKLSDTMSAGINFTSINDRNGIGFTSFYAAAPAGNYIPAGAGFVNANIQNLEAHFSGTVGPAKLNAEVDMQMGDATDSGYIKHKFKGNQVVLQAAIAMDPVTINATVARGSGDKTTSTSTDVKEYIALMDADVHYTLIYEYLLKTAAKESFKNRGTGFGNTTALSVGAGFNVTKNLMVGADVWLLQATEKITPASGADTNDMGTEIDAKVNWKMYENLTWNTTIGYFMPGDAYKISAAKDADTVTAIHSVLSFKF